MEVQVGNRNYVLDNDIKKLDSKKEGLIVNIVEIRETKMRVYW